MLLERPGPSTPALFCRSSFCVGANLVVAETAAAQLQHAPLQLAHALPLEQVRRQVPVGASGQRGGDLLPRLAAAGDTPAAASGRRASPRAARLRSRSRPALAGSRRVSSGSSSFLTSSTSNPPSTFLPRSASFGASSVSFALPLARFAGLTPSISLSKSSILPSRKLSIGRTRITSSSPRETSSPSCLNVRLHVTIVARLGRAVERHQLAVAGQHLLQAAGRRPCRVNSRIGRSIVRPFHCGRSNSGRTSRSNSNVIGPSSGTSIASRIEVRLADRRELLVLGDLRHAVHQQRALHLVADVLAKAGLDQLARRTAGAEARHRRLRHQLAEGLVEVALDVLARDRSP